MDNDLYGARPTAVNGCTNVAAAVVGPDAADVAGVCRAPPAAPPEGDMGLSGSPALLTYGPHGWAPAAAAPNASTSSCSSARCCCRGCRRCGLPLLLPSRPNVSFSHCESGCGGMKAVPRGPAPLTHSAN